MESLLREPVASGLEKDGHYLQETKLMKTTQIFAAAKRVNDGKYFCLHETFATTSPGYSDHPAWAKRIYPFDSSKPLGEATHYFESSDRMRRWLEGCVMVWIQLDIEAKEIQKPPPGLDLRDHQS